MKKEEFVSRILDGVTPKPKKPSEATSAASFSADDVFGNDETTTPSVPPPADTRFAQLLLEEVFAHGEAQPRDEIVLGDQRTSKFLPNAGIYWPKTNERPFHIVLFEVDKKGRELLADPFFRQTDQLEDALHRIVQDVLEGFEKKRTASARQGAQTETLCVASIVDDRASIAGRQLVCFGTKSTTTSALEVFTLREEVRDWDRPLAEEHLDQLFSRHFEKLASGAKWQDAFITGAERKKVGDLLAVCMQGNLLGIAEEELRKKLRDVLDEIAGSFGINRKGASQNRRLDMIELPVNHGIGADPVESQKPGFKNPLQGVRIYDRNERLLGFIVYVASTKAKVELLREALATNNHFHNVLVIYPDSAEPELELWQGRTPLRGRLTRGPKRTLFDGEGGVVQLLSRFFVVSKSAIEKPKQLATELAWRAQHLKALAAEELKKEIDSGNETGPLKKLFDTFNATLATLTVEKFADAYAQTITYGMLAARWISSGESPLFTRKNLKDLLPETSAFLKDLFDKLVNSNFDKNLSWLLDDITSLLARTSVAQVFRDEKRDPSIHFYEDFLDAYDPQVRKDQGVYYTPDEVVSYIVRAAHAALKNDFGLRLGLADTTTWAAFAKARNLKVPEGVDPKAPFVQVLDPALGTGTFLLCVIEVIHETMTAEFKKQVVDAEAAKRAWVSYVRKDLLPRINGFERMTAPYIVSHLRLGLALQQTGFLFDKQDRLRVFLTDTLSPPEPSSQQTSVFAELIVAEAQAALNVRRSAVSVVLGNPPYSKVSQNRGAFAESLVRRFKDAVLGERNVQPLGDDYIKFIAFGALALGSRPGLLSMITNRSFLDGLIHRGLRQVLMDDFTTIRVVDLHGDANLSERAPDSKSNDNIFNITQGVAILALQRVSGERERHTTVDHCDVWGTRDEKLAALQSPKFVPLHPEAPMHYWVPFSTAETTEYSSFIPIESSVSVIGMGLKSRRDAFLLDINREALREKFQRVVASKNVESLRTELQVTDNEQWSLARMRDLIAQVGVSDGIFRIQYRPYDWRYIWYHREAIERGDARWPVMQHLVPDGLTLLIARQTRGECPDAVFVSRGLSEMKTAEYSRGSYAVPIWLIGMPGAVADPLVSALSRTANFKIEFLRRWAVQIGKSSLVDGDIEKLLHYIYAILSSTSYRKLYSPQLRTGFPRVPIGMAPAVTDRLAKYGALLVALHLLEEDYPAASWSVARHVVRNPITQGSCHAEGCAFPARAVSKWDGRWVAIRRDTRVGPVSIDAWSYCIGGYQVLEKWLKARRPEDLVESDILYFCKVCNAIEAVIQVVAEVEEWVASAGGWRCLLSDTSRSLVDHG